MKTLPAGLPPLPSGYVYLGLGGSFKLPDQGDFYGASFWTLRDGWEVSKTWGGDAEHRPYAAPANSEIVLLNTPPVLDLSKLPIGTRLRRRDGSVGVLVTGSCFSEATYRVANAPRINDYTVHFSDGRCNRIQKTDADVVEILPDEAPSELEALKARVAVLEKELADGKAKTCAAAPAAWKPAFHRYPYSFNTRSGESKVVMERWHSEKSREAGLYFKTKRASDSAAEYRTFFPRLLNLAAELNPSGLVGGQFNVAFDQDDSKRWEGGTPEDSHQDMSKIFETKEAAEEAAQILNRDDWKPPVRK